MPHPAATAGLPHGKAKPSTDSTLTICAISAVAAILSNTLHEGIGHGLIALLSGAKSGILTTVVWSSTFDSRLVEAGGTLVQLAAALGFWLVLRGARNATMSTRYFLLIACAFNLFSGTGYFFFSGVTNFGDWSVVISGLHPHWLLRALLVAGGASAYYAAVRLVGVGLVRFVGVRPDQRSRMRRLTFLPYFSAIVVLTLAALLNPVGVQLLWQSALPAAAGGHSGLLWLQHYIPRATVPSRTSENLARSYMWIVVAAILTVVYLVVLGRGIVLHH